MRSRNLVLVILAILFVATSCADVQAIDECVVKTPAGFWSGLGHGIILPFSFIGSWFNNNIAIYAVNNVGFWYDLGFLLGVGTLGGGTTVSKS